MQSPLVYTRKAFHLTRLCGPMDKAPVYGTGDSRFDPWQSHAFFFKFLRTWGDAARRQLRLRKVSHRSEQCGGVGGRRHRRHAMLAKKRRVASAKFDVIAGLIAYFNLRESYAFQLQQGPVLPSVFACGEHAP